MEQHVDVQYVVEWSKSNREEGGCIVGDPTTGKAMHSAATSKPTLMHGATYRIYAMEPFYNPGAGALRV